MSHVKLTALAAMTVFILAAGTVSRSWPMYFMAGVLIALPIASLLIAWLSVGKLAIERVQPPVMWARTLNPMRLRIRTAGSWPRLGLQVSECEAVFSSTRPAVMPVRLPIAVAPGEVHDDAEDTEEEPAAIVDLPVGGTVEVQYTVVPAQRGVYHLENVLLTAFDPIGLFVVRRVTPAPAELVVYPLPRADVSVMVRGGSENARSDTISSRLRGAGTDVDSVRPYIPGDPLRRMHWKTLARTGQLHVLEFEELCSHSVTIVLDCDRAGAARGWPDNNFERLVDTAASLADEAAWQRVPFSLLCTGSPVGMPPHDSDSEHLLAVMDQLARITPSSESHLSEALASCFHSLAASGTVVLLTGYADPALGETVAMLRSAGAQVFVVWCDRVAYEARGRLLEVLDDSRQPHAVFAESVLAAGAQLFWLEEAPDQTLRVVPFERVHDTYA